MNMNEDFKTKNDTVINATASKATGANDEKTIHINLEKDSFFDKFSDKPINKEDSKSKLKHFIDYLNSKKFVKDVNKAAKETGIAPKEIAKNFVSKSFGVVGDTLGIAIDICHATVTGLIDLLYSLLTKSVDIIASVLQGLIRLLTFNQTNKEVLV